MTKTMSRTGLVFLVLLLALTLAAALAGCGDDGAEPTSSTTATTGSTTSGSTNETTIVEGGKSLDEYRAEIPTLEEAVKADPQDVASLEGLAVAHYQLREYDKAIEYYQKILVIVDDAFIHNALANVYRDQEKYDQAIAEYLTAIKLDPTLKHPYINLAGVYRAQGDLEKALAILDQAKTALNAEDAKSAENYQEMLTSTTTTVKSTTTTVKK